MYYLHKTEPLLPVDSVPGGQGKIHLGKRDRLRPEFMRTYGGGKLNPDFSLDPGNTKQSDISNDEISGAHKYLVTRKIKSLLANLDSFDFVPLSSEGLKKIFHEHGVNMRYLGDLVEKTSLPHVSIFMVCEMIARSSTKCYDKFISHFTLQTGLSEYQPEEDVDDVDLIGIRKNYQAEFEDDLLAITLQFLNLTISNTPDAEKYWDKYIVPQCELDFGYLLPSFEKKQDAVESSSMSLNFKKSEIPIGMFCSTCFYHFNVKMKDRMYSNKPGESTFVKADILGFNLRCQAFSFSSLKIFQLLQIHPYQMEEDQKDLCLQMLRMRVDLFEMIGNSSEAFEAKVILTDALLKFEDFEGALAESKSALNLVGPFAPEACRLLLIQLKLWIIKQNRSKIEETFRLASGLVVYNLGEFHPLHATLRSLMA